VIPRVASYDRSAAVTTVCVALEAARAAAKLTNRPITLGESIGSVHMGVTRAPVHRILGRPSGGRSLEVYATVGLTVGLFRRSTAVTVGTNNARYATATDRRATTAIR
jgi:hypothetical protein